MQVFSCLLFLPQNITSYFVKSHAPLHLMYTYKVRKVHFLVIFAHAPLVQRCANMQKVHVLLYVYTGFYLKSDKICHTPFAYLCICAPKVQKVHKKVLLFVTKGAKGACTSCTSMHICTKGAKGAGVKCCFLIRKVRKVHTFFGHYPKRKTHLCAYLPQRCVRNW